MSVHVYEMDELWTAADSSMGFLTGQHAVDVSRMTDLPWYRCRVHNNRPYTEYLDLLTLDWWDQLRVAWCLIGGYYYLNNHEDKSDGVSLVSDHLVCVVGSGTAKVAQGETTCPLQS